MHLSELGIPGLPGLLDADGHAALRHGLTEAGWTARHLTPVQFLCRPAHSASATYHVEAEHRGGDTAVLTVTVACRRVPDEPAYPADSGPYTVWLYPYDPLLPGLPAAAHGTCLPDADNRGHVAAPEVERVTYRPRHRAVMRYRRLEPGATTVLFAKVLRPARARALWTQSRALKAAGPHLAVRLALPFARRAQGVLLSRPLPGERLRTLLLRGAQLPDPGRIARIGDELADLTGILRPPAAGATGRCAHPAWACSAARLLATVLPHRDERTLGLAERIAADAGGDPPRLEAVHGDLHEAQILVAADGTLGLVDLDDLGHGDPALDAATLSAHLLLLAEGATDAAVRARVLAYREEVRTACVKRLDCGEDALRWREAYRLLLLASGPLRALRPDWPDRVSARLDLVEQVATGRI